MLSGMTEVRMRQLPTSNSQLVMLEQQGAMRSDMAIRHDFSSDASIDFLGGWELEGWELTRF
jgi:hypothetical protein